MTLRQELEYQADQIEMVLWTNGVRARVYGGRVTPRLVRFQVALPVDARPEQVHRLQAAIAHRLGAEVRVASNGGQLVIEASRADRATLFVSGLICDPGRECTVLLGLGVDSGRPLFLRLASPDVAHVLVAGQTGSGKTQLLRSMLASLTYCDETAQVYVIDPQGAHFDDLSFLPHLALGGITSDLDDAADVIGLLVAEMDRRAPQGIVSPRLVLFVDELADLVLTTDTLAGLTRLTGRGRNAGIHLVAGTQKPTSDAIGSLVKSNFPVRLVGKVGTPEDAKVASGLKGTGAEGLMGRGDFLLCPARRRFQAPLLDDDFVRALYRKTRTLRRPDADPLAEYRAYTKARLTVLPGGLDADREARRILDQPGWTDQWWDGEALRYGVQSAIGEEIGKENAGAGRSPILAVKRRIEQLLSTSTTSTRRARS